MSKLGKNLAYIALVGAVVAMVFAFLVSGKTGKLVKEKESAVKELSDKAAALDKAQKDLADNQAKLDEINKKVEQDKSEADALQAELTAAKGRATSLDASVKEATEKASVAEQRIKRLSESFGGKTPEDIKAATLKAQAELLAAQTDRKQLETQLVTAKSEVSRVTDALRRTGKGEMPPGLSGKIQSINKNWNFVVLNLGDKDGVVRNGVLVVYRNKEYIGRVKVTSTEANTCVADIVPEATKAEIRIGDDVLN